MVQVSSPSLKPASIISRPSSPSLTSPTHAYATGIKQRSQHTMSRGQSVFSYSGSNIQSGHGLNNLNQILDGRSGILLNKEREDLCWDHLFMVCGGTGITP